MSHNHAPENFNLAFAVAVLANLAFTVIEAGYAMLANSMSLLADAGHNLGDVLGLLLAWIASYLVTKAATAKFSYGYKRTTILAAIINALILVATSVIIAHESIQRLLHPAAINEHVIIIIAFIGIFINGGTALLFMRGRKDDLNIKAAFLHLAYDCLISLGVVATGVLVFYTGWQYLDPVVGLMIVAVILVGTWSLLRDSVNLLLDAVPHNVDIVAIRNYLDNVKDIKSVHDLHVWGLSTKEAALTCHLVADNRYRDACLEQHIAQELKERFHIGHTTLQIEYGDIVCCQKC